MFIKCSYLRVLKTFLIYYFHLLHPHWFPLTALLVPLPQPTLCSRAATPLFPFRKEQGAEKYQLN